MDNTNQNTSNSNKSFNIEEAFVKLLLHSEMMAQQFEYLRLELETIINSLDSETKLKLKNIISTHYAKIEAESKIIFQIDKDFVNTEKSARMLQIISKAIRNELD